MLSSSTHLGSRERPLATYVVADPSLSSAMAPPPRITPEQRLITFRTDLARESLDDFGKWLEPRMAALPELAGEPSMVVTLIPLTGATLQLLTEYGPVPALCGVLDHPTDARRQCVVCWSRAWIIACRADSNWREYAHSLPFPHVPDPR